MHPPLRIRFLLVAFASLLTGCARDEPRAASHGASHGASRVADDFGDSLTLRSAPRRIVSLNPPTTELLFAIGAGPRLVGRTTFDRWPPQALALPDLGNGLRPNVESVLAAKPDLVVLYGSDDNRDAARRLRAAGVATASYRVDRIADFERVTRALGALTGDSLAARATVDSVRATVARVRAATATLPRPTVFWPLYDQPLLATGGGSFLNELIDVAGGRNIYAFLPEPSPRITVEDLLGRDPDIILVSPDSRARYLADPRWRALRAVREGRVLSVDTTLVFRPGPRLGEAARSLAMLLHPGVRP
ncbi:MAG TPA: helical backbone metal receptor [Gemmatimonadaceae bacterium]|nr:helical backbone metal receptor [Gemmatimonadaceae bacterium]